MDGCREGAYRIHEGVVVVVVWDGDVFLCVLLFLERPGDAFGVEKVGVLMVKLPVAVEKTDVFQLAQFCLPFRGGLQIFA